MSAIYTNPKTVPLSSLASGTSGVVLELDCSGEYAKRLAGHGIVKGVSVKVAGRAPFGGLMRIEVLNTKISLRENDAKKIIIQPL